MMNTENLINEITKMKSNEKSKDEICGYLMANGIKFGKVAKFLKDAGLSFRRSSGNTWKDIAANAFLDNPDLSEDEFEEAITGSINEGAEEYYRKGWYEVMKLLRNAPMAIEGPPEE